MTYFFPWGISSPLLKTLCWVAPRPRLASKNISSVNHKYSILDSLDNTSILTGMGLVKEAYQELTVRRLWMMPLCGLAFHLEYNKVRLSTFHHYILGSNVYILYLSNVEFTKISYQEITFIFLYLNGWKTWRQTSTTTWVT